MGQEGCVYNRCSHLGGISQFIRNEWGRKVVSTIGVHTLEVSTIGGVHISDTFFKCIFQRHNAASEIGPKVLASQKPFCNVLETNWTEVVC